MSQAAGQSSLAGTAHRRLILAASGPFVVLLLWFLRRWVQPLGHDQLSYLLEANLVPDLPELWKQRYQAIHNIGVICVIFKLAQAVTPHFWVNISEPDIEIPGIIEFTNLRSIGGDTIVYVPYYMPVTNEKFQWPGDRLIDEAFACLKRVNPALTRAAINSTKVARLTYGQPICEPGFAAKIPPVGTPIAGLQIADTCFYYPEDRGIAESVRLGKELAGNVSL